MNESRPGAPPPRRRPAGAPLLPEGAAIDPRALFGSSRPAELELGPGNGSFLLGRIERDPELCIVGLEVRTAWALRINERIRRQGAWERARVFAEDAREALPRLAEATISRVYAHFPDPWWKKRHRKRLLLQRPVCDEIARVLCDHGELFVQTDVPERAESYEALLLAHPAFAPFGSRARCDDPEFGARSARERRALADGLPIVRLRFVRKPRTG